MMVPRGRAVICQAHPGTHPGTRVRIVGAPSKPLTPNRARTQNPALKPKSLRPDHPDHSRYLEVAKGHFDDGAVQDRSRVVLQDQRQVAHSELWRRATPSPQRSSAPATCHAKMRDPRPDLADNDARLDQRHRRTLTQRADRIPARREDTRPA